ncbi:MAG: V-type ATP synthase subunit E [Clostridia bacterium]|nr:V-type ATP synthase subunit E [Clostridia bacterium]
MSGSDKILASIREECEQNVRKIRALAQEDRNAVIEKAHAEAAELLEDARRRIATTGTTARKAAESRAELEKRNAILKERRTQIDRAVVAVEQTMLELPDEAYFELLCKMAAALEEKSGVILLNSKDLARVPSDFITRLSALGITATLCDTPNDSIRGGFILKNGDIEDNMTFPAVIADRRDELEDLIGRTLFEA